MPPSPSPTTREGGDPARRAGWVRAHSPRAGVPHPARCARHPWRIKDAPSGRRTLACAERARCRRGAAWVGGAALLLSACTVGPDYQRARAPVPAQYKEGGWKVGEPLDAIDRGACWSVYKDSLLDDLEKQIDI